MSISSLLISYEASGALIVLYHSSIGSYGTIFRRRERLWRTLPKGGEGAGKGVYSNACIWTGSTLSSFAFFGQFHFESGVAANALFQIYD